MEMIVADLSIDEDGSIVPVKWEGGFVIGAARVENTENGVLIEVIPDDDLPGDIQYVLDNDPNVYSIASDSGIVTFIDAMSDYQTLYEDDED